MGQVSLVMPMAGRGSRFARGGALLPKPLLSLWDRPFFWWAVESARRAFPIGEMIFVVLQEHVHEFAIEEVIRQHYPDARVVICPQVTRGAAETAKLGVEQLISNGPLIVNDSDHAFATAGGSRLVDSLSNGTAAALLSFASTDPAYSYARLDGRGEVIGTVEKQPVSNHAIAGGYLFSSPAAFLDAWGGYEDECPYDEVFVSGLYDRLIASGRHVALAPLDEHISFGTPDELERLETGAPPHPWASWS